MSTPAAREETLVGDGTDNSDGDKYSTLQERKRRLSPEMVSDVGGVDSSDSRPPAKMGCFDLDS